MNPQRVDSTAFCDDMNALLRSVLALSPGTGREAVNRQVTLLIAALACATVTTNSCRNRVMGELDRWFTIMDQAQPVPLDRTKGN